MEEGREGEKERLSPINTDLIRGKVPASSKSHGHRATRQSPYNPGISFCLFPIYPDVPPLVLQSLSGAVGAE